MLNTFSNKPLPKPPSSPSLSTNQNKYDYSIGEKQQPKEQSHNISVSTSPISSPMLARPIPSAPSRRMAMRITLKEESNNVENDIRVGSVDSYLFREYEFKAPPPPPPSEQPPPIPERKRLEDLFQNSHNNVPDSSNISIFSQSESAPAPLNIQKSLPIPPPVNRTTKGISFTPPNSFITQNSQKVEDENNYVVLYQENQTITQNNFSLRSSSSEVVSNQYLPSPVEELATEYDESLLDDDYHPPDYNDIDSDEAVVQLLDELNQINQEIENVCSREANIIREKRATMIFNSEIAANASEDVEDDSDSDGDDALTIDLSIMNEEEEDEEKFNQDDDEDGENDMQFSIEDDDPIDSSLELAVLPSLENVEVEERDSLSECKMVVQWSETNLPVVPSRNDPSHCLSDEAAIQFIKQKELIPEAYRLIIDDPRLMRLKLKYDPNIFSLKGAKQFGKNMVDPSTIPYLGILFHADYMKKAKRGAQVMDKLLAANENPELKETIACMKGAQITRAIQETANCGIAVAAALLPVVDFIPGATANLMILGQVGTQVVEKGSLIGLRCIVSSGAQLTTQAAMGTTEAFDSYGACRAFISYLGLPKNDDKLYSKWEPARLRLKALFGCEAEDDLFKMKPKDELLERIHQEEKMTGKPFRIEVPLLILLFRSFRCWDDLYWDRIVNLKDCAKAKTRKALGMRRDVTLEERRRMRDYRYLKNKAAYIENIPAIDPHLILLDSVYKKQVIRLMTDAFLHSNHVAYIFNREKLRLKQRKSLKWFMTMVVEYFFDHDAFIWGYVSTTKQLRGVAIWERPNANARISFMSLLRTSGVSKLGATRWKLMSDVLFKMEDIRQRDIGKLECWMLHWLCIHPIHQKEGIGRVLVENCIRRHKEPVYTQVFDIEEETILFFNKLCFVPLERTPTNFTLFSKPVSVCGYWYGINSPTELRALLPAPKKRGLLAYNTLKRVATSPLLTLPGRAAAEQLRLENERRMKNSDEQRLYREALSRFEEASTLVDSLKIAFAQLPTEGRDTDPVAISLQQKITEQQHLVEIYRKSLSDAKANMNVISRQLRLTEK